MEDAILGKKNLKRVFNNGKSNCGQEAKEILSGIRYKARTACFKAKASLRKKLHVL